MRCAGLVAGYAIKQPHRGECLEGTAHASTQKGGAQAVTQGMFGCRRLLMKLPCKLVDPDASHRLLPSGGAIPMLKSLFARPRSLFLDLIEIRRPRFFFRSGLCGAQDPGRCGTPQGGPTQHEQQAAENRRPASCRRGFCNQQIAYGPYVHSVPDHLPAQLEGPFDRFLIRPHDSRLTLPKPIDPHARSQSIDASATRSTSISYPAVTKERRRVVVPTARPRGHP